jgi:hypothetical protein
MERDWSIAAFPMETSVLKLRLRPYSSGHEILLCQIGSPFALGGNADWFDLFVAVLICSNTFADGRKLVCSPRKVRLFCRFWKWILKLSGCSLQAELAAFTQYLTDGRWSPPTNEIKGDGWTSRTLKAPRVYRLIPMLCSQLNLSRDEALDFPMAEAHTYSAALADRDGAIDLSGGSDEASLLKHLAELEARAAKGEPVWDF